MAVTLETGPASVAEEDRLRADLYGLLAALLARPPSGDLLRQVAALNGDDSELGAAVAALAHCAARTNAKAAEREFNALFIGLGRGELVPYASVYLTGFLHEKPLARVRRDMAALGLRRAEGVFEPEDGIATLCEVMAAAIGGAHGAPAPLDRQRDLFNTHLAPWAGHFFADLEGAKTAEFYRPVGTVGRLYVEIEKQAFRLA